MARQSRGRLHFGRKQSSTSRSAAAVASAEAQANRRKSRTKKWRERFKKLALTTWQSNTIVQSICGMLRSSAETARAVRAATGSQIVGLSSRQLRMEGLEQRQMLTTTPWNLGTPGNFSQESNTALISGVDTGSVTEDVSLTASGALSATDVDLNPSNFQPTNGPTPTTYGSYTLDADGNWNYALTNSNPAVQALIAGGGTLSDSFNALSIDNTSHQVSITINGNDDVAVITGDSAGDVTEDTSLSDNGALTATDADAGQSSFQPNGGTTAHGSYTLDSAGNWAYSLNNADPAVQALTATGTLSDSFTALSFDGTGQLVTITIHGNNDPALISGDSSGSVTEDTSLTDSGALTASDTDTGQASFQPASTTTTYGSYALDADGNWNYTLTNGNPAVQALITGGGTISDSFTALSVDGTGQLVTITISGTNDVAVITGDSSGDATEDTSLADSGALIVTDPDAGQASFQPASAATTYGSYTLDSAGNWAYALDNGNPAVQALPALATLSDSFTALSFDGASRLVSITIHGTNDPALISGDDAGDVTEDTSLADSGALTATDPDAGQASFQPAGAATTYGSYTLDADGHWNYALTNSKPAVQALITGGGTLSDSFNAVSIDGTSHQVSITINGNDDVAVITGDDGGDVTEDTSLSDNGALTATDADAGQSSFQPNGGTTAHGSYTLDSAGNWAYSLNNADPAVQAITATGTLSDSFTALSFDGTSQLVSITIHGTNDPPLISGDDGGDVTEDTSLSDNGALTATDADAGQSSFQPNGGTTAHGSYTLDSAGNWAYSLNNADPAVQAITATGTLSDSFTALSFDGTSQLVSITIHGTNDPPLISGDDGGDVSEDGTLVDSGALTATDTDTGQSNFQPAGASTTYGSFTLDSTGNWAYTLNDANGFVQALNTGQTLNDSFTVVSNDGTTHLVNITISGLDEPPGVVILNGDDNNNSLAVNLNTMTYSVDGGTSHSLVDIAQVFFHGWAGLDSIIINGGALGSVTYDYTNANDGDINLGNGLVLHYTGLDPISNSGTVNNAVFNLPATGDNVSLVISSPGMLTLSSSPATFESTTFAKPSSGLTVNANNGDDTLSVQPSNGYTVSVDGGDQTTADTLNVDAAGAYAINTGSQIRVQGFANIAYAAFETVNLVNAALAPTTLYVDDSWIGTLAGADPDGLGAAINFGVDSFAKIQDAINAAVNGATILVHSGLYQEALTIGKNLIFNQLDGVGSVDVDATPTSASNGVDIVPATTTTPINISFNGFDFSGASSNGIHVGKNGAALASLVLSSSTITGGLTGVWIDGGSVILQGNTLTGNGIGVADAGKAYIVGNNFSSSVAGIDVNSGTALVQGNTFAGSIGVRIQNGGIADLGQNLPGINYTGLGVSAGGNTFSSYSATATTTSGAIVDLNTGGGYSNAGPQGYAGAAKDVAAFNNLWNNPSVTGIENVIWYDADNTALGFVDYALLSDLVVSLVPLPTIATNQGVNESQVGGTATIYGQFTNDAQAHKVTVSWGDGSPDTVVNLNAGVFTFAIPVPAGTYTDDPNGSVQTIHRAIGVKVEEVANPGNFLNNGSLSVDVNNVIPTATLSTLDNDLDEGETLSVNIGAKVDPGTDTVSAYRIYWGDGQSDVYTSNMSSPEVKFHLYQDGLANPNRTVTLHIYDEDGSWNAVASLAIQVHNVNPTAGNFFSFDASVSEGSTTTVFFVGPFADPGNPDAPFHFAYDFNGNGVYGEAGESGDGTYTGSGTSTSEIVPASFLADGPGPRTVNARIIDNDGGFTQYSVVIGINNVAPVVDAGADTTVFPNTALNHVVNFTDPGADAPWTVRINWDNAAGFDETFNVPARSFNINSFSTWMYTNANIGNTYNVQVQVDDNDGGVGSDNFNVSVVEDTLRVTNFVTNNSGFDVTLSRAPNLTDLNLYDGLLDGSSTILDPADVTLIRNGSQNIRGSIVWAPDTNTLSFVATGGVLVQGNYSVTLLSSTIAFHAGSNLLDGDGDFNDNEVADNYTNSFVVGAPDANTRVVSLPDFSRGPGQAIGLPGTGSILPIKIDSAVGVQAVDVDVLYNPQLMTITAASLGTGPISAGGWSLTQNSITIDATHRLLKLTLSGAVLLSGSNVELIRLTSSVPGTATYESSQVIRLQNLRVNEDLIASKADNAIHKVIYVGDADGDGAYGGADAGLISRAIINLDSGFDTHDWTDPQIVGDASGDGTLSGLDASYVAQEAVFIDVPVVPVIPSVPLMLNGSGADPQYTVDDNIHAVRGSSVTVPVQLTVPQPGDIPPGVVGSTFDLFFDPSVLTFQSATNGSFWTTADGWTIFANATLQPGRVTVSMYNSQGQTSSIGQGPIANVTFGVSNSAPVGNTSTLDVGAKNPNEGHLTWSDNDGSLLFTNFPGDYNQSGVVESGDYVLFRKTQGNSVPNFTGADGDGTGIVAQGDYDLWRANFGTAFSPGAGAGMSLAESGATSAAPAASASTLPATPVASEIVAEQPAAQRQSASVISEPTTSSAVSFTSVETAEASIVAPTVATSVASYESAGNQVVANFADQAFSEAMAPSHHSRTAALAGHRIEFSSRLADANWIDLALATPKRFEMDGDDSLSGDHNADHAEAIDELFAEMDDDALAVRLGV